MLKTSKKALGPGLRLFRLDNYELLQAKEIKLEKIEVIPPLFRDLLDQAIFILVALPPPRSTQSMLAGSSQSNPFKGSGRSWKKPD